MNRFVRRRIGPFIVPTVRKRHVAHAERSIRAQHAEVAGNHVAAFDAHQRGDSFVLVRLTNLIHGRREHEFLRVPSHLFADSVNLVQRFLNRGWTGHFARYPDGKENRTQSAFAHAWNINAARVLTHAQIEFRIE